MGFAYKNKSFIYSSYFAKKIGSIGSDSVDLFINRKKQKGLAQTPLYNPAPIRRACITLGDLGNRHQYRGGERDLQGVIEHGGYNTELRLGFISAPSPVSPRDSRIAC